MSNTPSQSRPANPGADWLKWVVVALLATAAAVALYSLRAWWEGDWQRTVSADAVPMAPSTAWLVLLLSAAIALRLRWAGRPAERRFEFVAALFIAVASLAVIASSLAGAALPWEGWLAGTEATVRGVPVGRMSPLTATVFLLTTAGLLSLLPPLNGRRSMRLAGAASCVLGGGFSLLVALAYVSGTPLFYDRGFIPMAFATAACFVLLGLALGLHGWIEPVLREHRRRPEPSAAEMVERRFRRRLVLLTAAVAAAAVLAAVIYLREEQEAARLAAWNDLDAVATLKADQIRQWREERLSEARFLRHTPAVAADVAALLADPDDPSARARVAGWLAPIKGGDRYESVALVDTAGGTLFSVPAPTAPPVSATRQLFARALAGREILLGDLVRDNGSIHLDLVVPMLPGAGTADASRRPAGVLHLRLNPAHYLFPILRRWPTGSETAESLLLRRDGDEYVYLSDLRHTRDAALRLRRPVRDIPLSAANSAMTAGIDYRGVPVLFAARAIPDSTWILVCKINQEEVFGPMRREALLIGATVGGLLVAVLLAAAAVVRRRQRDFLQRLLAAEQDGAAHSRRFAAVMQHASDCILLLDSAGRILDANDRTLSAYGYTLEELRALPPGGLRAEPAGDRGSATPVSGTPGGDRFETVHRRKDGSTFPVEVGTGSMVIDGRRTSIDIYRDITQRKEHEAQIERLNRYYAALSQVNTAIVHLASRDPLFAEICRVLVTHGRFKMAWAGWRDDATGAIRPVAQYGDEGDYLAGIRVYADDRPEGRGPTGTAVREGRTCVCHDFLRDPSTSPWRERAAHQGFRSSIALPLRQSGRIVGALTLYSEEADAFGVKEIALLEEAAADLSFALDLLEREARRRCAESELLVEKSLFNSLTSTIPDHIYFKDLECRFTRINESFARTCGLSPEEAVGRTDFDLFTEEHARKALADDRRVMTTGKPIIDLEERETWPDGRVTWVSTTKVPLRDAAGNIVGLVGVSRDITERRAAEDLLRASDARFRALFENSLDGFLLTDPADGRVLSANPAACQLLGRTEEQILGSVRGDLLDPADPRLAPLLQQRAGTGRAQGELTFIRGDGTRIEVEVSSVVYSSAEGPRTSMVLRDLTARREAERRIREQAGLLDKASEAIVVLDLDQRITYWNRGAEKLFGAAAAEMLGQPVEPVLSLGAVGVSAPVREGLATMDQWRGEVQGFDREGRPLTIETSITLIRDADGRPASRFCVSTDITEKKRLQEQYMRAQRLESIGMLSAGIAHDLNNVLAPVLMAVPLLRDRTTDPRDLRLLDTVEKSATRGSGLVRQILGFAHGIGGEPRLLQPKHILREIVEVIEATFPKSIRLEHHIPSDLWTIKANPTQLHQVMLNLCVNARDAMPDGGILQLRAENRALTEEEAAGTEGARAGSWLVVHVEDNGSGIPADILPRVWDPFFTTKGAGKGTGLGLSTVRGIVANHQGFITLETEPGRGTAFHVHLPAAETEDAGTGSARPFPVSQGHGELILFVDDEQSIRDLGRSILTRAGYRVLTAADGAEAAAVFSGHAAEIRLIVTDLAMPNFDGAALAGVVRQFNPAMKILAISGGDSAAHPIPQTVDGYLPKPFSVGELLEHVRQLLPPGAAPV